MEEVYDSYGSDDQLSEVSTQTPIQTRIIGPIPGLLLAMPQITRSASLQPGEREFPSDAAASYVTWKIGTMQ